MQLVFRPNSFPLFLTRSWLLDSSWGRHNMQLLQAPHRDPRRTPQHQAAQMTKEIGTVRVGWRRMAAEPPLSQPADLLALEVPNHLLLAWAHGRDLAAPRPQGQEIRGCQ